MFLPYKIEDESEGVPWMVYIISAACIAVYFFTYNYLSEFELNNFFYQYGCIPSEFKFYTTITCTFLHGGIMHLLGNLYFFWIYGSACEKALGATRLVIIYLTGAIVSVSAHVISVSPFYRDVPTIGASGAISAMLGAFLVLFPTVRIRILVLTFGRPLPAHAPAYFVLGCWFLMQIFYSLKIVGDVAEVAFWAHIAGFAAGALVASAYQFILFLSRKRYQQTCLKILSDSGEALKSGADMKTALHELSKSDIKHIQENHLAEVNLFTALMQPVSDESFNQLFDEFLAARKEKDHAKAVFCYYSLAVYHDPDRLNSDMHLRGAHSATAMNCPHLAIYAYYNAFCTYEGETVGLEKILHSVKKLLTELNENEKAAMMAGLLAETYPNSALSNPVLK